jgi:hypothetical protein
VATTGPTAAVAGATGGDAQAPGAGGVVGAMSVGGEGTGARGAPAGTALSGVMTSSETSLVPSSASTPGML